MRYIISFLLFINVFVATGLACAQTGKNGVTVLIYHRFGEDKYPTTNVSAERFREQLAYLMMNNYRVISLDELISALQHDAPLPDRAVVITIDDGYRSVYETAWPILKSFGYPFTVFLYAQGVEEKYRGYMNWDQVRELQAAGVDFQDHTYSHFHLADRPKGADDAHWRSWIKTELQKGYDLLAARLGEKPKYFAFPYGEYNTLVIEEAKSMGYAAMLTQDPGSISQETDLNMVPREPILGHDWSTMAHFEEILGRVDMPVTVMEPGPIADQEKIISRFGATLLYPERYKEETLGIYVSGLGWHKARRDGNFVYITNQRPLPNHISRVSISGREKESGKLALHTWMVLGK